MLGAQFSSRPNLFFLLACAFELAWILPYSPLPRQPKATLKVLPIDMPKRLSHTDLNDTLEHLIPYDKRAERAAIPHGVGIL